MCDRLLSVGLDVGTTTTQLILSRLTVENQASAFAVPDMQITGRTVIYESPVHFTPLKGNDLVDAAAIRELVTREYAQAGICREDVDTGAIIITGETSRKENARAVLQELSGFAGDFVVATAGPDLESILAAKGSGAVAYSAQTGKTVLHMDIGGGTSNLALICDGVVCATGCLNVGGRLLKFSDQGEVTYVSKVLKDLCPIAPGDRPQPGQLVQVAEILAQALEMAAGVREQTDLLDRLMTVEAGAPWQPPKDRPVISFSGGVADCIEHQGPLFAYGDMGVLLGRAIRASRLCQGEYMLGKQTIRATVIGAGCHSTQLSGSTVFYRGVTLPLQNLPVAALTERQQEDPGCIRAALDARDGELAVLAIPGYKAPDYDRIRNLADAIVQGVGNRAVYVCVQQDMAKALGHCLQLRLPADRPCLCIDRLRLAAESYLDIGQPVGPCLPVVIKTLVLANQ